MKKKKIKEIKENSMKAIIISLICRTLIFISILGFVFGICYFTKNLNYLWLLWLLFGVWFIPIYEQKRTLKKDEGE
jgi:hypothetical protein